MGQLDPIAIIVVRYRFARAASALALDTHLRSSGSFDGRVALLASAGEQPALLEDRVGRGAAARRRRGTDGVAAAAAAFLVGLDRLTRGEGQCTVAYKI